MMEQHPVEDRALRMASLTEARRTGSDEFFGDAELARVVGSTPASDDLMHAVLDAHRWIGEGTRLSDDISLVVIESVEQAAPAGDSASKATG
ncbi:MAG: hypothetical protein ABSF88_09970 [Candidatus Aminicenantales bacterium]